MIRRPVIILDLTPPVVTFTSTPRALSNNQQELIRFHCNEPPCSMVCKVMANQMTVANGDCSNGLFRVDGLQDGKIYVLSVTARDSVGNQAQAKRITWEVGELALALVLQSSNLSEMKSVHGFLMQ